MIWRRSRLAVPHWCEGVVYQGPYRYECLWVKDGMVALRCLSFDWPDIIKPAQDKAFLGWHKVQEGA